MGIDIFIAAYGLVALVLSAILLLERICKTEKLVLIVIFTGLVIPFIDSVNLLWALIK